MRQTEEISQSIRNVATQLVSVQIKIRQTGEVPQGIRNVATQPVDPQTNGIQMLQICQSRRNAATQAITKQQELLEVLKIAQYSWNFSGQNVGAQVQADHGCPGRVTGHSIPTAFASRRIQPARLLAPTVPSRAAVDRDQRLPLRLRNVRKRGGGVKSESTGR